MQKKRFLLLLGSLLLAMVIVVLPLMSACGPEEEEEVEVIPEEEEEEEETKQMYHMIYQNNYGPNDGNARGARYLFRAMREALAGTKYDLSCDFFYNCALYGPLRAVEATATGAITWMQTNDWMLSTIDPRWGVSSLPFLGESKCHQRDVILSPFGESLHERLLEFGIYNFYGGVVPCEEQPCELEYKMPGSYAIYTPVPIRTMEDLAGLRIRVLKSFGLIAMGEALGFMALGLEFGEVAVALQTGMLDGVVTSPSTGYYIPLGLPDKIDYVLWWPSIMVNYGYGYYINSDFWFGLPDEMREILEATLYTEEFARTKWLQDKVWQNRETLQVIKDNWECTCLTLDEYRRWQDALEPTYEEWAKGVEGGAEAIAGIKAARPPLDPPKEEDVPELMEYYFTHHLEYGKP